MQRKHLWLVTSLLIMGIVIAGCRVRDASETNPKEPTVVDQEAALQSTTLPSPTAESLASPTPTTFSQDNLTQTALAAQNNNNPTVAATVDNSNPTMVPTTAEPTVFVLPSDTPSPFPTDTATVTPLPSNTPLPTNTPLPSATFTPSITPTFTPFPSVTPANTAVGVVATQPQQGQDTGQAAQTVPTETVLPQQLTATQIWIDFAATQGTFIATTDPNLGQGQPTQVPGNPTFTPTGFPNCDYYIEPGDRLLNIAITYNLTTEDLIAANPDKISDENLIEAGDTIVIPGCGRNPTITPTFTPNASLTPAAFSDNSTGPIQYTVEPGDNIYRLSVRFNVTMTEILSANPNISDINSIFEGDTITIPTRSQFDTQTTGATPTPAQVFPTPTPNVGQPAG